MPALGSPARECRPGRRARQAAQLGVAAEQYRLRHGKFPAQLDDWRPTSFRLCPLDPFDGKPMKMKRTEHGLIVYSIGPDMVDNGGAPPGSDGLA